MRLALLASSLLVFAACGGGTSTIGGTSTTDAGVDAAGDDSGGGGGGGGDDGGTEAGGDSIWPADATKLVADSPGGGFTPQPPPGSDCKYGEVHYTLDRTTHTFGFDRCAPGATGTDPLQRIKGSRVLTTTEQGTIESAMNALVVSKSTGCGADKGVYTVTVTTPRGETTYYDSFYICNGGGKIYVDEIDGVFAACGQLAPIK